MLFSQNWSRFQPTVVKATLLKSTTVEFWRGDMSEAQPAGITINEVKILSSVWQHGHLRTGSTITSQVSIQETISACRIRVHCTAPYFLSMFWNSTPGGTTRSRSTAVTIVEVMLHATNLDLFSYRTETVWFHTLAKTYILTFKTQARHTFSSHKVNATSTMATHL